ncbi:hypothetical protein EB155_03510, partial [archaeon]|nr:hypothetical protein [archaeon]
KLKLNGEELLVSANSLNLFQTIDSLSSDNTLSNTSDTQLATSKAIKDYIDVKTDIISDFINGTPLPGQILVGNDQNKFEYVTSNGVVEFFANGYSTLRNSTVQNNMLANSFINIGTQRIELGNTVTLDLNDISSGVLDVSSGGTGSSVFEIGRLLIGNSNSTFQTSANLSFDVANQIFSVSANTNLSNVIIENDLSSNGNVNLNGTVSVSGNTSIDGNTLQISNDTETFINGNTYFNGEEVSYSSGTDLNVNGILNINGDFLNTSPNTTIYSQGDVLIDDGTLTTTEDSTVNFNSSQINFNSTTNTQINGNVSIDGNLTSDGNTTFNEVVTFNKSPNFTTDVTIAKNLNVEESVYVIGDLFVSGNTVTVEASRVAVEDNILLLGANNTSDLVDLGFVGQYYSNRYAGLVRSALDDKFYLIEDYYPEPGDTVHNFDANTMFATLRADVEANTLSTEIAVIDELTSQNITSDSIVSNSLTTSSVELDVITVDEINSSNTITINSDVELFENLTVKANTDELGNRTTVDFERDTVFRSSGLFEFHGETFYVNPWVPNIIMGKAFTISGGNVVSFFDQTSQSGYVNTSFTESFTVVSNTQNTFTSNNLPSTFDVNFNYLTATLNGNLIHNPNDYTVSNNVITLVQDAVLNDVLVINYVDPNSVNESNANTINTAVEFSSKLVSTSANTKLEVLGVANFETLLANNATINNLSVEFSTVNNIIANTGTIDNLSVEFSTANNVIANNVTINNLSVEFSTANNIIANTITALVYNGIYLDALEDVNATSSANQVLTSDGTGNFYFANSSSKLVQLTDVDINSIGADKILTAYGNGVFYFSDSADLSSVTTSIVTTDLVQAPASTALTITSPDDDVLIDTPNGNITLTADYDITLDTYSGGNIYIKASGGGVFVKSSLEPDGLRNLGKNTRPWNVFYVVDIQSTGTSTLENITANNITANTYSGIYLDMLEDVNSTATANLVLIADGTGNFYFDSVESLLSNSGLTISNNTFSIDADTEFIVSGNTIIGGDNFTINSNTEFVINGNSTFNNTATFNNGITVSDVIINNDLSVANSIFLDGDLYVGGNTVSLNAQTLLVEDNIVVFGANNAADITDLGFATKYNNGVNDLYAGMFRDATDGKFYLFKDFNIDPPVTTMNGFTPTGMTAVLYGNFEANNLIASSGSLENMIANNITMTYSTIENSVIDCGTF